MADAVTAARTEAPSDQVGYEALNSGAGLADRSHVGRLSFSGEDALDLLNRLSTNDLLALEVGQAAYTVLTSPKGRIVDLLYVLRRDADNLVFTAPETRQKVVDWIDFYTFAEDVEARDLTGETVMLSLSGPRAAGVLEELAEGAPIPAAAGQHAAVRLDGVCVTIVRSDFLGGEGYDLILPAEAGQSVWSNLCDAGASPVSDEAYEAVRVERGVPVFGRELGESYNPLEAGLLDYVSFTKGCYVGQEVVTRLNTYQKVQKRLTGFVLDGPAPQGAKVMLDGKQAGVITSVAVSPGRDQRVGLGYVKRSLPEHGTVLEVDGSSVTVHVTPVPSSNR
jgi:folate-binding protein YgfZ